MSQDSNLQILMSTTYSQSISLRQGSTTICCIRCTSVATDGHFADRETRAWLLQVFREADSGKTVVHTDLVLHAINATADAFPSEQKRLFLQDSQQAVNPDGPVISLTASVKDRSSDWL